MDFLAIKTNSSGNVGASYPGTWARTYGGTGIDYLYSLQQTEDGGYILDGYTRSFGAKFVDFLVIKTDALGGLDGCSIIEDVVVTVNSPSITLTTPSLSTLAPAVSWTTPSITVTSPSVPSSTVCPE
jgi:hypothetical protein